jgi:hypothetical protein
MSHLAHSRDITIVSSPFDVDPVESKVLEERYGLTWLPEAREAKRSLTIAESAAVGSALNAVDKSGQFYYFDEEDRLYLRCFSGNIPTKEIPSWPKKECMN